MNIAPVVVELSPVRRVASITVSNSEGKSKNFQAEVLSWQQLDGNDHYEETDRLLIVPPLAVIPPGASQIFRIALRGKPPEVNEETYRLIFEDITEDMEKKGSQSLVNLRLRYSLPIFVVSTGKIGPKPRLGICPTNPTKSGCVQLNNEGDRFVLVKSLTVKGGNSKEIASGIRVLAGAWKQWTFAWPTNHAGPLTVHAETSAGPLTIDLPAPGR